MIYSKSQLDLLPEIVGVYLFRDKKGQVLYIGKATNLKKRVLSYFNNIGGIYSKIASLVKQIDSVETIAVQKELEALLLEAKLIKNFLPKYNVRWRDDRHYIYIKITKEDFPRILLSRKEDDRNSLSFGPFQSTRTARRILLTIREIFPYCSQKRSSKKPCFYSHLGLCHPCPTEIKGKIGQEFDRLKSQYVKNIRIITHLLEGKTDKITDLLKKQMRSSTKLEDFEQAAVFRDKLEKLDSLLNFKPEVYLENPKLVVELWSKEQMELRRRLKKFFHQLDNLAKIECYDVANISGKCAAGSMVTFINGQPAKNYYRKFRIRAQGKANDFAMLSEVLSRRLSHKEWSLPELMVVDGGKPQLIALGKILQNLKIQLPLIGLSKKVEELVIPKGDSFVKLKLKTASPALHLIKRLRDEAHRFAHKYYEYLRLKSLSG